MNLNFWLAVSGLLGLAFLIILPALWKKRDIEQADSDQRNINIAKERVKDLKQQLQQGVLTQEQYGEQYAELELTLGDDLDNGQQEPTTASQGRWVMVLIVLFLPIFSVLSYLVLGEPDALIKAQVKPVQQAQTGMPDVNAMIAKLEQRLKQEPNNAKGWLMLGRTYKYLKDFNKAVNAFEKAYALLGEQPEVMLHYADALAMQQGGRLSGKAAELIYKALEQVPNDITALWLGGMAKAESGDFALALKYWHHLETLLPPDSESYQELQGLIASIQTPKNTQAKAVKPVSINVQVSIDPAIKPKLKPTDTVFIYAKALSGPPMPLAIVRKQVADLPLSVTLDDKMAMMPKMKLSNFQQVKVMARVSKSGTAMPQKGDFIGTLELKTLAETSSVVIVINEELKD